MTEPTDAEIVALLGDRQFSSIGAVREALRRWGTPAVVAGEPVAYVEGEPYGYVYTVQVAPVVGDERKVERTVFTRNKPSCYAIALYTTPQPTQADDALEDASRLDWLALAGPTSICVVMDRPHDGDVEVSTDDVTGYGKTLRQAIDAARKQGGA